MTDDEIKHLIAVLDGANLAQVGDDRIREVVSFAAVEGVGSSNALTVRLVRDLLIERRLLAVVQSEAAETETETGAAGVLTQIREALGLQPGASVVETVRVLVGEHATLVEGVRNLWRALAETRSSSTEPKVWDSANRALADTREARALVSATAGEGAIDLALERRLDGVTWKAKAVAVVSSDDAATNEDPSDSGPAGDPGF